MRQESIDLLANNYLDKLQAHLNINNFKDAAAIYQEFVVDGVDPENDDYTWLFLEDLTELV
tara:strand:+ start:1177 stop:1359 length:183 start_codon:yes stop_codon:yes gene_type:complete